MIFVPFHEGWLDYDCQECGAGCCCEPGFIVATEQETHILIQEHPFIKYFAKSEQRTTTHTFFRPTPYCWFLEHSGLCTIEQMNGYSLKPFICRLHPFYVARCGNDNIVIPSGCPRLRVTTSGQNSHIIHESVLTNAQEAIDIGHFNENINWSPDRLDIERAVLEESMTLSDSVNYLDYAARQMALVAPDRSPTDIQTQLSNAINLWKAFLGIENLDLDNWDLTRELTTMTSLLRVSHHTLRNMPVNKIPLALLALYVYMVLFSHGRKMRRFVGTYESVLSDVPLGLVNLTDADLRFRNQPLEKRLHCVRTLRELHSPGFRKKWDLEKQKPEL